MQRSDFTSALRDADRRLRESSIPPDVAARLEGRLFGRTRPSYRRTYYALVFAGVAACILVLWATRQPASAPPSLRSSPVAWLELKSASDDLVTRVSERGSTLSIERGSCTLVDTTFGATLETANAPLELAREGDALRIVRGRVSVHVAPRRGSAPPVRFLVSHGALEVVGTKFLVDQAEGHGSLTLYEGIIEFHAKDGTRVRLTAGQSFAWPRTEGLGDAGTTAAPVASAPRAEPRPSVVERLEYIQGLRSRGQWSRAADELVSLLREPLAAPTRERLSYELGSIYTYQLHDRARACAQWRIHRGAYARGRYAAEIEQAQRSLDCADSPR